MQLTYSEEFKRDAVQLLLLSVKSWQQIEEDLGIEPGLLPIWRQQMRRDKQIKNDVVRNYFGANHAA